MDNNNYYYYTYKIEFKDGYYYYGVHKSKSKIDHHYTCSSKYVLEKIERDTYYTKSIVAYYDTFEKAIQAEQDIIKEHIDDIYCMNKQYLLKPCITKKKKTKMEYINNFFKEQYKNIIR